MEPSHNDGVRRKESQGMQPRTKRQTEVWECIRRLTRAHGYPPTRSEIARELARVRGTVQEEITQQTVDVHVNALAAKGWLEVDKGKARALKLRTPDEVPLVRLEIESVNEETMPGRYADAFEPRADYFAEVADDTMEGLGVRSGDLLAVKKATSAQSGDVVIAELARTRTCRRIERTDDGMVRLAGMPAKQDETARPIILDEAALRVEGIVIGTIVFRGLHSA